MDSFLRRAVTGTIAGIFFFGVYTLGSVYFSLLLGWILVYILTHEWFKLTRTHWLRWITPLYPVLPVVILVYASLYHGGITALYPFIIAWTADMGAYFVGKNIGKHRVCPSISPKKSWEGLAGGLLFVFLGHLALGYYIPFLKLSLEILFLLSVVITAMGFLGDIFISYLKRKSGLKDAGSILPGHGGLLDRFDSVFFIAYVFAILLWLG